MSSERRIHLCEREAYFQGCLIKGRASYMNCSSTRELLRVARSNLRCDPHHGTRQKSHPNAPEVPGERLRSSKAAERASHCPTEVEMKMRPLLESIPSRTTKKKPRLQRSKRWGGGGEGTYLAGSEAVVRYPSPHVSSPASKADAASCLRDSIAVSRLRPSGTAPRRFSVP